jgi:hypothetical protein
MTRQNAPVLAPLEPPGSLTGVLLSRLPDDPILATVRGRCKTHYPGCACERSRHCPDPPHPALRRILIGHIGGVALTVAIAPTAPG